LKALLLRTNPFVLLLAGCVTGGGPNDCFEFGVQRCVSFYQGLSQEERTSGSGVRLYGEICSRPEIRCAEDAGDHPFALKLKMAEQGYADLWLTTGSGQVTGIFQRADTDPKLKEDVQNVLATAGHIRGCDQGVLASCEKIVSRISWGVGFDSFFQKVPPAVTARARERLCQSKDYQCLTFDHVKEYNAPRGWTLVQNSTTTDLKDGRKTERRDVIIKRQ
jgi:hypothetical protein